ncbi:MAG TPA: hypothetical protein VGE81_05710 [Candidatus Limnocylindrales bacterium]|jgi:hypothetical protein
MKHRWAAFRLMRTATAFLTIALFLSGSYPFISSVSVVHVW